MSDMDKKAKERVYDFCAYRGCVKGKFTTNARLYRFPKRNDPRLAVWIKNAGNERLKLLAPSTLRRSGLCEEHFEPSCFIGENKRLSRNAVPKAFVPRVHVSTETKKVEKPCLALEGRAVGPNCNPSTPAAGTITGAPLRTAANTEFSVSEHARKYRKVGLNFSESDDEECAWRNMEQEAQSNISSFEPCSLETLQKFAANLQKQIRYLKKSYAALRRKNLMYQSKIRVLQQRLKRSWLRNMYLERKAKKESVDEFLDRQKCREPTARTMIKLQLHRKRAPYSEEEKDLAKQLYHYSASTYTHLRNAGCSFPSGSSVRSWVSEVNIKPGSCNV